MSASCHLFLIRLGRRGKELTPFNDLSAERTP
jgi:hypothetical protein